MLEVENDQLTSAVLREIIERFERVDDVWKRSFLRSIVLQSRHEEISIQSDAEELLHEWGNQKVYHNYIIQKKTGYPEGPYFMRNGRLHAAYLLYPDTAGAFIVSTIPSGHPYE